MTAEERFEKIERDLAVVAHVHTLHQETLGELMKTVTAYVDSSSNRMARIEDALAQTNQMVSQLAKSADSRMRRTEDNLDALIRAIAAEHSNGKN